MSELLEQPGVEVVGCLPPELQHFTLVDGALHPKSKNSQIVSNFLEFLQSPEALAIMTKAGVAGPSSGVSWGCNSSASDMVPMVNIAKSDVNKSLQVKPLPLPCPEYDPSS